MSSLATSVPTMGEATPIEESAPSGRAGRTTRARLAHVDAMRPVKQLGVVSTHSLVAFAPSVLWIGAGTTLLHVSREAFFFVSACMLTYGYQELRWSGVRRFWRRRLAAVGLPYLLWTLIYFLVGLHGEKGSPGADVLHLGYLVLTGYSQLYFLLVLLEFYVLFPVVAWLLRATKGHHATLVAVSLVLQLVYLTAMHWSWMPPELLGTHGVRIVFSYQFYLLAGCVAAVHYEDFHALLLRHVRGIVLGTLLTAGIAEAAFGLFEHHVMSFLGDPTDAFDPLVLPFNCFAIALIYLVGVALVRPGRPRLTRRLVHVGVEDSYAIYLSQLLFINVFLALGFKHLNVFVPWPLALIMGVMLVYFCGCILGEVLARTPLARAAVGRSRAPRRQRAAGGSDEFPLIDGRVIAELSAGVR